MAGVGLLPGVGVAVASTSGVGVAVGSADGEASGVAVGSEIASSKVSFT